MKWDLGNYSLFSIYNEHRTNPLRHYAYSKCGTPAVHKITSLGKNLTCTATISVDKVEFIRFFSEGGTTNEVFMDYFDQLLLTLKKRYPQQMLVFILDNLHVNFTYVS